MWSNVDSRWEPLTAKHTFRNLGKTEHPLGGTRRTKGLFTPCHKQLERNLGVFYGIFFSGEVRKW